MNRDRTRPNPPRRRRFAIAALASTAGLLLLAGCSGEPPAEATIVRPVKTTVVSGSTGIDLPSLAGVARASNDVELAFQVPGVVIGQPAREGQLVAKGEVIAQLRPDEFRARLTALQGQLEQSQAVLRTLKAGERPEQQLRLESNLRAAEARAASEKAQFERIAPLLGTGAIGRAQFDQAEAEFRVTKEEVKAAQQLLEQSRIARTEDIEAREAEIRGLEGRVKEAALQLDDTTIRAPFDGVVAKRFIDTNQSVNVRQPVARFQSVEELDVSVDVPEALMATDLRSADLSGTTAEFTAIPGKRFPVQLGEIAQVADPITQTFRVHFILKTPPGANLLPGMSAIVHLGRQKSAGRAGVVYVPPSAVYTENGGPPVAWLIGPDMTVQRRPVKLGAISSTSIEILDGLAAGDRIAIAGVSMLRDGMKVRDLGDALGTTGGTR
jgi:multidrug efflux system membrane fusion protein